MLRGILVAALGFVVLGCGQLLDTESYQTSPEAPPLELLDGECANCLESEPGCARRMSECWDDPACRAAFDCVFRADNPNALFDCVVTHAVEDPETCTHNPRYLAVVHSCATVCTGERECRWGMRWECRGKYAWRATSQDDPFHASFSFKYLADSLPLQDARVRACAQGDRACSPPIDDELTDSAGIACLALTNTPRGFGGQLWLSGVENVNDQWIQHGYPLVHGISQSKTGVVTDSLAGELLRDCKLPELAPGRGVLGVQISDCWQNPAEGVRLEASPPANYVLYLPDFSTQCAGSETSSRGSAILYDLPVGEVTVTARRADDGQALACASTQVVEGADNSLYLLPYAEGDSCD